jgi:hypothetical protein
MISFKEAKKRMEGILQSWGIKNRYAFTALLIGGILAIMIGAVLLVVSYVVVNAVVASVGTPTSGPLGPITLIAGTPAWQNASSGTLAGSLNASWAATIGQIVQALGIIGIALVVTGIAIIVYVLIGLGGTGMGAQQR